jgi:hypothetical protein
VTNHHYGISWNSLTDPLNFRITYSVPDYLNMSTAAHDWVGLTFGFIQVHSHTPVTPLVSSF